MELKQIIETVVDHVIATRKAEVTTKERSDVVEKIHSFVVEGDYSFTIPTANVSYFQGANNDYPRLYGDAILSNTVSSIMAYKDTNRKSVNYS